VDVARSRCGEALGDLAPVLRRLDPLVDPETEAGWPVIWSDGLRELADEVRAELGGARA
jgi:hypothetical protein